MKNDGRGRACGGPQAPLTDGHSKFSWAVVAGYCGLLAAFAIACTMLATRAFRAYQAQV